NQGAARRADSDPAAVAPSPRLRPLAGRGEARRARAKIEGDLHDPPDHPSSRRAHGRGRRRAGRGRRSCGARRRARRRRLHAAAPRGGPSRRRVPPSPGGAVAPAAADRARRLDRRRRAVLGRRGAAGVRRPPPVPHGRADRRRDPDRGVACPRGRRSVGVVCSVGGGRPMRISIAVATALLAAGFMSGAGAEERGVLTYHNDAARSGHFVVAGLTWDKARALRPDARFAARVAGHLYAQPLAWRAPGSNTTMLLTASEDDVVQAFDGQTGNELWRRAVGPPAAPSSL